MEFEDKQQPKMINYDLLLHKLMQVVGTEWANE